MSRRCTLLHGDCLERLREMPDCSVDSIVTDPPAGIGFMSKDWDSDRGGRDLPRGFGPWFAGMVDAAGSLVLDGGPRECMLEVHGAPTVLRLIREYLGGEVVERGEWTLWRTSDVDHAYEIAAVLKRFNPQGQIGRSLETWQVALRLAHFIEQGAPSAPIEERWLDLREMLRTGDSGGVDFVEMEHEHRWIAWLTSIMREALRVLRPGGHALVWALPRTSHWTATAIEDAGFEIRDRHHHIAAGDTRLSEFVATLDAGQREQLARILELQDSAVLLASFGSGFPKSLNVEKAGARRWKGHGTALKPAVEHWVLARKPLDGTVAANVLAHGTGALAIDACRIGAEERPVMVRTETVVEATAMAGVSTGATPSGETTTLGRWPAHLSLEHAAGCRRVGEVIEDRPLIVSDPIPASDGAGHTLRDGFGGSRAAGTSPVTRSVYDCVDGCPVRVLDEQSEERKSGGGNKNTSNRDNGTTIGNGLGKGNGPGIGGDTGGASRFFLVTDPGFRYVAKPSRREKDAGLEDLTPATGGEATGRKDGSAGTKNPRAGAGRTGGARNQHPTVKAVTLMRWLVRLITPPGGLVLDPFAGSGTTGVACADEGMRFLGIEQDEKHHEIARLRLRKAYGAVETELPAQAAMPAVLIAQPRSAS